MPPQQPDQQIIKFKPQDLSFFKNTILVFIIAKLVSIGVNIFFNIPLLGTGIDLGGTAILIYGIYKMSNDYSELRSGLKVAILFGGVLSINLLSDLFNYLDPVNVNTTTSSAQDSINQLNTLINYFYVIILLTVISGVITVITAYYFTNWFNIGFSNKMTQIKAFYYYGIIFFAGEILLAIAFIMFNVIASGVVNSGIATSSDLNNITTASDIGVMGTYVVLAGLIAEIIASIKIYNRVTDFYTGKYFFQPYFSPYQQFFPGNPNQQPYQGNPYQQQQPYQQPYQVYPYQQPFPNNPYQQPYQGTGPQPQSNINSVQENQELPQSKEESFTSNETDALSTEPPKNLICKNCSIPLPPQTKFCFRCGQKVE